MPDQGYFTFTAHSVRDHVYDKVRLCLHTTETTRQFKGMATELNLTLFEDFD